MVKSDYKQNLRIRLKVNDKLKDYMIVDPQNINPNLGLISWESPLAKALQGKQPGEMVNVSLPNGQTQEVKILLIDQRY